MKQEMFYLSTVLKISLTILLFLCLADMPYGYYQLVRFIATFIFGYLAFIVNSDNKKNNLLVAIYIALAILFQPFIKIALGRTIWNIVDVIVGVFLIASIFVDAKTNETSN